MLKEYSRLQVVQHRLDNKTTNGLALGIIQATQVVTKVNGELNIGMEDLTFGNLVPHLIVGIIKCTFQIMGMLV